MQRPIAVLFVAVAQGVACSNGGSHAGFTDDDAGSAAADGGVYVGADGAVGPAFGNDGGPVQGGPCVAGDPNADQDKDGFTPAQGDCNDCDPNVNPGAIDVLHTPDAGPPSWGDEDCSGKPGDSAQACDTGLALADVDPMSGAKAIDLCAKATTADRKYGVLSAAYVRADGTAFASPGLQVGIHAGYGTGVHPQAGANLLALSTGHARVVGETGACGGISCQTNATGTPPTGFPQDDPACPPTKAIADDVALELSIRVPTNATGYSFSFKFYSFEFPDWVCDKNGYNDQFVALVSPPPAGAFVPPGSSWGNVSFDGNNHPVSVNVGYFDACDPATPTRFASHCKSAGGACPAVPSPYCPLGLGDLAATGFDVWHTGVGPAGATRWLQTQAPAKAGSVIKVRFAIWDAGNAQYDSTALIDDFQWVANGASGVVTLPQPGPK
jgi:hypothetical protein